VNAYEANTRRYEEQIAAYHANTTMSGFKGLPERVELEHKVTLLEARVAALERELADLHLFSKEE
jgi:hypothetical protein